MKRGIDTNVLLRSILQDDPVQSRQARAFVLSLSHADPGYVSVAVMLELHWVLATRYRIPRKVIGSIFTRLFSASTMEFGELDVLVEALHRSIASNADFADAVIAGLARRAGCDVTVTFDRKSASRLPEMELLA
ncbi:PIN domain-containing protein [Jiella mangrovi]|uniref:Type II toxin-antitoxin system VapC family toxin n=1 Tax=Jiella mangrovi TaxID=2821407 RepID=A0ABS4BDS8_9HYPH|nr:type II toxin-antitoxin system VapC family toxin [Jiella mangrovi]MBP0614331.1 type II toxin-antitoxin system VapC family toxin [Jiella mangrovi]